MNKVVIQLTDAQLDDLLSNRTTKMLPIIDHIRKNCIRPTHTIKSYLETELLGYQASFQDLKNRNKYNKLDYVRGRIDAIQAALEIQTIIERSLD